MADNVADRIIVERDGIEVAEVTSITPSQELSASEAVVVMNRSNRPIGHRRGVPKYTLSMEVVVPVTGEYNWHRAHENGTYHNIVLQYGKSGNRNLSANGRRMQYLDAMVLSVGDSGNSDGVVTRTIEMSALDRIDE